MAHYAAWLARRWHDPIFPKNWPHFGTEESWERETIDLEEQSIVVARVERGGTAAEPAAAADEEALTNKDLFWDWDGWTGPGARPEPRAPPTNTDPR